MGLLSEAFGTPEPAEPLRALAPRIAADYLDPDRRVDPLRRLLDPGWTETLWEYEHSRTEPLIPGSLHPKQREALESEARHRWLFWGNQVGKTTVGAIDFALYALGRHPHQDHDPGVTMWASALTWDLWEQILLPELLTWIPPERIIDAPPPKAKSTKRTIKVRADNGRVSRIIGKSAEQGSSKYQSARIHRFWMDEEHPLAIWREVQPRLVRFGGSTIVTMTPLLGMTWVYHQIYEPAQRGGLRDHFMSHAGLADNPAIGEEEIEALKRALAGDPAQLAARLHGLFARPQGLAVKLEVNRDFESWPDLEALAEVMEAQSWEQFCGIDFGEWRFGFIHCAADRAKRVHVIEELFSQRESLETRARWIHRHLERMRTPARTRIWGDSANPQHIREINLAFDRIGSQYRVAPVSKTRGEKVTFRRFCVLRINDLLARNALLFRRGMGEHRAWKLRQSASSDGVTQIGSRLLWELNQWRYPEPREDQAQTQDPDDDTADGADLIAALRYAVVSWWRGAVYEAPETAPPANQDHGLEKLRKAIRDSQKAARGDTLWAS